MRIKTEKPVSFLVIATTAAILLSASASAVEFEMSGQVNRLIMNVDNGEEDGTVHANNSNSGMRLRIKGEGDLGDGLTLP